MTAEPPPADRLAGMLVYATETPGIGARLRMTTKDFQVEELIELGDEGSGPYPIYRVEKDGMGTMEAAAVLERAVRSRVSFAGLKDKKAVAVQYMGPTSRRAATPKEVLGKGFRARLAGYYASPVKRGMLNGNRFRVSLRDTGEGMVQAVDEVYARCRNRELPNFFGYQRFGLKADTNYRVGRAIIKRDFAEAVSLQVGEPRVAEADDVAEARRMFRDGRYGEALAVFRRSRYLEASVVSRLAATDGDHLGALRTLPITLRRLFVNAYQAYIFNNVLSLSIKEGLEIGRTVSGDNWAKLAPDQLRVGRVHGVKEEPTKDSIPLAQLVGFAFRNYGSRFDRLTMEVLAREKIEPREFYIKEADEMSSEGGFRHSPLLATGLSHSTVPDGLVLEFSLAKGEYATTLLREIIKPENPLESGF